MMKQLLWIDAFVVRRMLLELSVERVRRDA